MLRQGLGGAFPGYFPGFPKLVQPKGSLKGTHLGCPQYVQPRGKGQTLVWSVLACPAPCRRAAILVDILLTKHAFVGYEHEHEQLLQVVATVCGCFLHNKKSIFSLNSEDASVTNLRG